MMKSLEEVFVYRIGNKTTRANKIRLLDVDKKKGHFPTGNDRQLLISQDLKITTYVEYSTGS